MTEDGVKSTDLPAKKKKKSKKERAELKVEMKKVLTL